MEGIKRFATDHPQITSWIVLAIGMVIILVWSAREVGFTPSQWAALIVTTILLAGACVWIIGWEDDEDEAVETEPEAEKVTEASETDKETDE
jgi:MFS superfamily sulfate permease-like transporter